jgi:hypothetical protein
VEPGDHVVEARLDGYTATPSPVHVDQGGSVEVTPVLAPMPPPAPRIEWVSAPPVRRRSIGPGLGLAALAVVGLGGGGAFIGASLSKRADAQTLATQILSHQGTCLHGAANYDAAHCPMLQRTLHADDTFHDVAVGAFIVGGAAALATATYFLWPQRGPSSGQVRLTPVVGTGSASVVVSGSF